MRVKRTANCSRMLSIVASAALVVVGLLLVVPEADADRTRGSVRNSNTIQPANPTRPANPRGPADPRGARDPRGVADPRGVVDPRGARDPRGAYDPRGGYGTPYKRREDYWEDARRDYYRYRTINHLLRLGAYYATPQGWEAIGYVGNIPLTSFDGPPPEVLKQLGVEQTVK